MAKQTPSIRDRVKELVRVRAGDLVEHPGNWRTHPKAQLDALRGAMAEIGFAGAVLNRRCFAVELDPVYCQTIIDRWEAFSGKKADRV